MDSQDNGLTVRLYLTFPDISKTVKVAILAKKKFNKKKIIFPYISLSKSKGSFVN